MESGTLPPATMLLHSNEPIHPMPSSDSSMNQFSDIFSSRPPVQISNKPNKRKLDELSDPSSTDLESLSAIKPQKTEQTEPERSLSRTGTPLSNGPLQHPPPSSTPSRNGNDNGPSSYDFGPASNTNNNNNNNNIGRTTPNSSLFTQQTPPPPSLQQQQPPPTMPPSSYMSMSPRNQYTVNNESPFLQTNNQVFVFTTQLANEAAEAVMKNDHPNIIEYHRALPSTTQYLNTLSNNMNNGHNNSLLGGPIHMNHGPPPPGCHSPRTMQMMMGGPGPHNPHLPHPNGGPPPNWPHPHYHPHQQQPPFGRLTPGPGGLPPPNHLMPPGPMMMNGQPPSDGIENLTPERAKHRKNQLNKIEDLKSKITGGRARGGRSKANANAAAAAAAAANMPPSVNGGPLPPGPLDPHQQQMMMMNSPHGVGPPHHMMGIGPPPPHMLPPGMRGPDGMMLDMNGVPQPHPGYMNGPMPPNFPGQYGPGPGDLYGQLPPPHLQSQAARDWNKMQMEHMEGKGQLMRGQPPPYSSASPSSLTPPIATTSAGGNLGPNGKLLSPKMEPSGAPRLYKVGQPEKFIPDSLPSAVNKKLGGNVGEVQLTASPTQMDYNEFGMEGEELMISRHLNRAYRPSNGVSGGPPIPSSSSSLKDEPMTPMTRSTSTPNNNMNPLSCGQPLTDPGTPTHISQGPPSHLTPSGVSAASPRPGKLPGNSNLSSPLMLSNNPNSSAKDEPLDMNGGPKTPTSNMAPPLSSMLQMTNSLQSANSPYNSSTASSSKPPSLSSNLPGSGPSLASQNLPHMTRSVDQLPPPSHMSLPPHHHHQQQQQMQFQNMNPHHRMMGMLEPMPPHFNPHQGGNLPPPHPHMYKMMPPHHAHDPSGMMLSHPGGPPRSSKGLPPLSSDPMQQHLHHLPPPHYGKMHNMDPMLGGPPPPGHPQQHMRFPPMMDEGFGMGQPPPPSHHPHHPHMHPHMQPHPQMHHQPMHPNDGRPPPQSINNTYVSTTMSIQQLNIQNLGPGGPPPDLQTGTIHYHASSGNGPDGQPQGPPGSNGNNTMFASQQQFTSMSNMSTNDPSFAPQFNDLQPPPSNLGVDGVQQLPYW